MMTDLNIFFLLLLLLSLFPMLIFAPADDGNRYQVEMGLFVVRNEFPPLVIRRGVVQMLYRSTKCSLEIRNKNATKATKVYYRSLSSYKTSSNTWLLTRT